VRDYKQFSKEERKKIYYCLETGCTKGEIAKRLGRHRSAIYREIERNSEEGKYVGGIAQEKAEERHKQGRTNKIRDNSRLQAHILRELRKGCSPEQISGRLKRVKAKYYVCCESIYSYIYSEESHEWYKYLERQRKRRQRRYGRKRIVRYSGGKSIHDRPKEVWEGKEIGHWEGDTINFSKGQKANVTTLIERKTLFTFLAKNKDKFSRGVMGEIKNMIIGCSKELFKTITFDQGAEFSDFREIEKNTKCQVYYCDAHAPWQRGSNENMNRRLRRYLPRGMDIESLSELEILEINKMVNDVPRKKLDYLTPKEALALECKRVCRT
jgi:IS30 family transposase